MYSHHQLHTFAHQLAKYWFYLLHKLLPLFQPNQHQQKKNISNADESKTSSHHHPHHQNTSITISSFSSNLLFSLHQQARVNSLESLKKVAIFISRLKLFTCSSNKLITRDQFLKRVMCILEFDEDDNKTNNNKKKKKIEWNIIENNDETSIMEKFSNNTSSASSITLTSISFDCQLLAVADKASATNKKQQQQQQQQQRDYVAKLSSIILHLMMTTSSSQHNVDIFVVFPEKEENKDKDKSETYHLHLPFSNHHHHHSDKSKRLLVEDAIQDLIMESTTSVRNVVANAFKDEDEISKKIKIIRSSINNKNGIRGGKKFFMTLILSSDQNAENFLAPQQQVIHSSSASNEKNNIDEETTMILEKANNVLFRNQFAKYLEYHGVTSSSSSSSASSSTNDDNHDHDNNNKLRYLVGCFLDLGSHHHDENTKHNIFSSSSFENFEKSSSYEEYQRSLTAHFFALLRQSISNNSSSSKLIRYLEVVEARTRHRERMTERCRREKVFDFVDSNNNNDDDDDQTKHKSRHTNFNHKKMNLIQQEEQMFENLTRNIPIFASSSSSTTRNNNETNKKKRRVYSSSSSLSSSSRNSLLSKNNRYQPKALPSSTSALLPYGKFEMTNQQQQEFLSNSNTTDNDEDENYYYEDDDDDETTAAATNRHRMMMLRSSPQLFDANREDIQEISSRQMTQTSSSNNNNNKNADESFIFQFDRKFLVCGFRPRTNVASINPNNNNKFSSPYNSFSSKKLFIMDQHAVSERGRLEAFRVAGLQKTVKKIIKLNQQEEEEMKIPLNDDFINEDATAVLLDFKTKNHHRFSSSASSSSNNQYSITNRQIAQLTISFAPILKIWGWTVVVGCDGDENNNNNNASSNINNNKNDDDRQQPATTFVKITTIPCFVLETFELQATKLEPMIEFILHLNLLLSSSANINNNNINNNNIPLLFLSETVVPPILERFAVSRSCRGAIMFHDELNQRDMKLILKSVVNTSQFDQCSHGRVSMKMMNIGTTTTNLMMHARTSTFPKSFIEQTPYADFV